jgi:hypothetical protein
MAAPNYPALVEQAEKAVQSVKDPELKRIAFQKVLDDLLAADGGSSERREKTAGNRARRKPNKGESGGAKKKPASGPRAYIREMHEEGFFKKPKTITDVKVELENRGHHIPMTSLSGPLQGLCKDRVLRRQRTEGKGKSAKKTFSYSNW